MKIESIYSLTYMAMIEAALVYGMQYYAARKAAQSAMAIMSIEQLNQWESIAADHSELIECANGAFALTLYGV